ncbi:MAG TPA: DUF4232 domain-containing protein [Streptosporangiaceae bacterium]|nr:DUF4232 domain-containing protein [Streptosporangiaceae bacterium]
MLMKLGMRAAGHAVGGTALMCAAALLPGTAFAAAASPVKPGVVTAAAAGAVLAELSARTHSGTAPARSTPTGTATTSRGSSDSTQPAWRFRRCKAWQTQIWMGIPGSGAAGTIFYPLEFTNISKHPCKIWGFPRVTAKGKHGQIGKAARHVGSRKKHVVELWPGQTAHARLGIIQAGNVCSKPVWSFGLKVRAPHQGRSTVIPYSFLACFHKRVLVVGPVRKGVGIP